MSYLESQICIERHLNSITDRSKKNHIGSILNQFNIFCQQSYNKTYQQVMNDLKEETKKDNSNDNLYVLFNNCKIQILNHWNFIKFLFLYKIMMPS